VTCYVVRVAENHDLVGFISASSVLRLAEIVDEICPPSACEYARLPSNGGIYWAGYAAPVPFEDEEELGVINPTGAAQMLSDDWSAAFYKKGGMNWKPLVDPEEIAEAIKQHNRTIAAND